MASNFWDKRGYPVEANECVFVACSGRLVVFLWKKGGIQGGFSRFCGVCVLCDSVVYVCLQNVKSKACRSFWGRVGAR